MLLNELHTQFSMHDSDLSFEKRQNIVSSLVNGQQIKED